MLIVIFIMGLMGVFLSIMTMNRRRNADIFDMLDLLSMRYEARVMYDWLGIPMMKFYVEHQEATIKIYNGVGPASQHMMLEVFWRDQKNFEFMIFNRQYETIEKFSKVSDYRNVSVNQLDFDQAFVMRSTNVGVLLQIMTQGIQSQLLAYADKDLYITSKFSKCLISVQFVPDSAKELEAFLSTALVFVQQATQVGVTKRRY